MIDFLIEKCGLLIQGIWDVLRLAIFWIWDVLKLGTFYCIVVFWKWNILWVGRLETSDIMRSGTFYIRAFLDLGHFATVTFCIGLLCL
jgi:hypothetical protein